MSMELPRAWSGSKTIGATEVDMRTVEGAGPATERKSPLLATSARSGAPSGIVVSAAAALAELRNSRREIDRVFMRGQYNGNAFQASAEFQPMKRFNTAL